jgi:SulP family sulfate permease
MALLNYGIIHNNTDRFPALICSLFNGALFFSGFPLLNYLPRFLLGGLLIFAGLPFISVNLIDSYHHMTKKEFIATWMIVILTALFGLLVGVVAGVGMAALIFAIQVCNFDCNN